MGNPAVLLFPAGRASSFRYSLKTIYELGDFRGACCISETAVLSTHPSAIARYGFFSLCLFLLLAICSSHARGGNSKSPLESTSVLQRRQQQEKAIQSAVYHSQLLHHKTGHVYNVSFTGMPSGSIIQVMRLRTSSLRKHAVIIGEFTIPSGSISVKPSPKRVLLVYENFSGSPLFPSSTTYKLVSRVAGLFAYDASTTSTNSHAAPRKLSIIQTGKPISLKIRKSSSTAGDVAVLCAFFEDNSASMVIVNPTAPPFVCTVPRLGSGYISLAAKVHTALGPQKPAGSAPPSVQARVSPRSSFGACKSCKMWAMKAGAASLGTGLVLGAVWKAVSVRRRRAKVNMLLREAEQGETLQIALIGDRTRAPAAGAVRTPPNLERSLS